MIRIKHERRARRLSQAQLGRAADISQPTISQIERGRIVPNPKELERLASCLGVPQTELLTSVDEGFVRRLWKRLK